MPAALWIFGYGSLVWRPGFDHAERRPGCILGFRRRFWQGSTDHRGVPGQPGRVVTLVRAAGARCWGMAYRVDEDVRMGVLSELDHRERGGYERFDVPLVLEGDTTERRALVYVATEANANYLGEAPLEEIAEQVRRSTGPSGPNPEYVLRLAEALREMGAFDSHVFRLAELLRSPSGRKNQSSA